MVGLRPINVNICHVDPGSDCVKFHYNMSPCIAEIDEKMPTKVVGLHI